MNICIIGTGYVGLVTGTCLAELGHTVVCVDKVAHKVDSLKRNIMPIFEDGLADMVAENVEAGRLSFTTDLSQAMAQAKAVFIAVGTPSVETKDGSPAAADLSQVKAVAKEIAQTMTGYTVVINKSTVPVGTQKIVTDIIKGTNPTAAFDVVSNPEFLREGAAIGDFMNPDRIVVGQQTDKAAEIMQDLYKPLIDQGVAYLETTPKTAELIKYAANALLATKISFINEMADICEAADADVEELAMGIGLDNRIGPKFLKPGPGFGGSCFPKDTDALVHIAQQHGAPTHIVESVVEANNARKELMVKKIISACGGAVEGKKIAILGLTFKANTDDVRQSVSLVIVPALSRLGADVRAYDPEGNETAAEIMPTVNYKDSAQDALSGADVAVILTEWPEFENLDWGNMKDIMAAPLLVDLRNILDPIEMEKAGYTYISVGRHFQGLNVDAPFLIKNLRA